MAAALLTPFSLSSLVPAVAGALANIFFVGGIGTWTWIQERHKRLKHLLQSSKDELPHAITEDDPALLPIGGATDATKGSAHPEISSRHTLVSHVTRESSRTLGVDVPTSAKPKFRGWTKAPPIRRGARVSRYHASVINAQRGSEVDDDGVRKKDDDDDEEVPRDQAPPKQKDEQQLNQESAARQGSQAAPSRRDEPPPKLAAQSAVGGDFAAASSRQSEVPQKASASSEVHLDAADRETSGGKALNESVPRPQEVEVAAVAPAEDASTALPASRPVEDEPAEPASTSEPVSSMDQEIDDEENEGKAPDLASPQPTLDENVAPLRLSIVTPHDPEHASGEMLQPKFPHAEGQAAGADSESMEISTPARMAVVIMCLVTAAIILRGVLRRLLRGTPRHAVPEPGKAKGLVDTLFARAGSGVVEGCPISGERRNRRHLSSDSTGGRSVHRRTGRLLHWQAPRALPCASMTSGSDLADQADGATAPTYPVECLLRQEGGHELLFTVLETTLVLPGSAFVILCYIGVEIEGNQQWNEVRSRGTPSVSMETCWRRRATAAGGFREFVPRVVGETAPPAVQSVARTGTFESSAVRRQGAPPVRTIPYTEQDEGVLTALTDFFRKVYPSCSFEVHPSTITIVFANSNMADDTPESARACLEHALRVCREDGYKPDDFLLLRLRVDMVDEEAGPAEEFVLRCQTFYGAQFMTPFLRNFSCVGHYVDVGLLDGSPSQQATDMIAPGTTVRGMPSGRFAPPFQPNPDLERSRVAQVFGLRDSVKAARKSLEQKMMGCTPTLSLPLAPAMQQAIFNDGVSGVRTSADGLLVKGHEALHNVPCALSRVRGMRQLPVFMVSVGDPVVMRSLASDRALEASVEEARHEYEEEAGVSGSRVFSAKAMPSWTARCLMVSSDDRSKDGFREAELLNAALQRRVRAWKEREVRANVQHLAGIVHHTRHATSRATAMVWPGILRELSDAVGVPLWLDGNLLRGRVPISREAQASVLQRKLQALVGNLSQRATASVSANEDDATAGTRHGGGYSAGTGHSAVASSEPTMAVPDGRAANPPEDQAYPPPPQQMIREQQFGAPTFANRRIPGAACHYPPGGFGEVASAGYGMVFPNAVACHGEALPPWTHATVQQPATFVSSGISPSNGAYPAASSGGAMDPSGAALAYGGTSGVGGGGGGQGEYYGSIRSPAFRPTPPNFVGGHAESGGGSSN